jgi:predicted outer membrane repeat protein
MMIKIQHSIAVIALLTLLSSHSIAQIHISGPQTGILSSGTYIVDGPLSVPATQSLVIEAGAEFYFNGPYGLAVNGQLTATGSEQDSIKFLPNTGIASWSGIDFVFAAPITSELSYVRISGSNSSGIISTGANLIITNSLIADNSANVGAGIYANGEATLDITNSSFINNEAEQHGGAILIEHASANITDSYFEGNVADADFRSKGGAISAQWATLNVTSSTFTQNHAGFGGGALGIRSDTEVVVYRSVFYQNSADDKGGAIFVKYGNATILNNTIDDNFGPIGASAIFASRYSTLDVVNNAITNHTGPSAIYIELSSDASFHYNDLYGNSGDNFSGNVPTGTGVIATTNANGHASDVFYNIFEDPEYSDPVNRDYNLTSTSALIDAGDPTSPYNPDGTIADIGAFYFSQGSPGLTVTLTLNDPPVFIPSGGGTLTYDANLENTGNSITVDVWTMLTLPGGTVTGPMILRTDIPLPTGSNIGRENIPQYISGESPAGEYTYTLYAGTYPDNIIATDSFTFEKLGDLDGESEGVVINTPHVFKLNAPSPNPFNPTTTLSFSIPEAGQVQLKVYNLQGRQVATLVDGFRSEGVHEITFDGRGLASGVYIYTLTAGQAAASGRITLLK